MDAYLQAARNALEHFPLEVEDIVFVTQSENVTFRVSARDRAERFVLRLHRPGYSSIDELESERVWTRALAEAGLNVPGSVKTRSGQYYVQVEVPGKPGSCYAGMTLWQEGAPLYDVLHSDLDESDWPQVCRELGGIIARFHSQSSNWQPPAGFSRRRLDVDGLLGEQPFWGRFWEHPALSAAERDVLLAAREQLRVELVRYGEDPKCFSLVHADLSPENIIYNQGELGLIDFDDAAFSWHGYDLASLLIDFRDASNFEAIQAQTLEGYQQYRPLEPDDLRMLPRFLLIRGMALMGWYMERPEHWDGPDFEQICLWVLSQLRRAPTATP